MPEAETNPLLEYFRGNSGRLIHKWIHYFDIYHRHFAPYRGRPVTVVEFGVFHGGSLQMWKEYFGPEARIVGVDINPECESLAEERVEIHIGDQEDRDFLRSLREKIGAYDVVIDDGGHTMRQQIVTFEEMYDGLVDGGVFLVEDLHTSYWPEYGGGYRRRTVTGAERRPRSFIEYSKDLIDALNAWHSRDQGRLAVDDFTRAARAMHFYDSVLVMEKGPVERPYDEMTGTPTFELPDSLKSRAPSTGDGRS